MPEGGLDLSFRISVERNRLRFAAGHFASMRGELEPLHGHNYAVMVEVAGGLAPDSWVMDFGEVKEIVRGLCGELDHKFILQMGGALLGIGRTGGCYEITFGDRRYVFPESDVAALPIDNTTAERLAEWFAGRIRAELTDRAVSNVTSITVGIEESPGQTGWFTLTLD